MRGDHRPAPRNPLVVISKVIQHYYPEWEPPEDRSTFNKTCCPFHGESRPSATVNFDDGRFHCFACGVKGDAIDIVRHEEGVSFAEAKRRTAEITGGGDPPVRQKPAGNPGRRVFGQQGTTRPRQSPAARLRGGASPWA
ncbi:CHC2 zinc finger domain-containing protein [Nocardia sp. IFM 10818]